MQETGTAGAQFAELDRVNTNTDRPFTDIVKSLGDDLSRLFRGELALLKSEMRENVAKLGAGAGMFGGAGISALFALEFLLLALMFGLIAAGLPAWASALLVAVVLGAAAALLAVRGKKNVAAVSVMPVETIEQVKADGAAIKDSAHRLTRT